MLPAGPLKLDKTHTEFVFFKASPDESTVEVVSSLPAGTLRCIMRSPPRPFGRDRDDRLPRPDQSVGTRNDGLLRYVTGIIIAPEYKPVAAVCRSPGAPK